MDKYERAALKLVNRIRKLQGKEELKSLLKGETREPESCPIANSINGYADDEKISFELNKFGELSVETDNLVQEFINRFDDNEYPHLLTGSSLEEYKEDQENEKAYNEED